MSLHALIIEDEVSMVDCVEQALRGAGYESFDIAFSGSEAIAAASRRCPDIITADLRLVDGSGVDAVLEICSGQAIPVVFITSRRSEISTIYTSRALQAERQQETERRRRDGGESEPA